MGDDQTLATPHVATSPWVTANHKVQYQDLDATLTFSIEVGRMVAGGVERRLRQAAHEAGVDISIERHMGWFQGVLLVKAEGESDRIMRLHDAVQTWEPFG